MIALRIEQLLKEYNLSASAFSDILQIQRSALSHIFSGRNKPSLDVIQKILFSFPELNPGWLLSGTGKMKIIDNQTLASDVPSVRPEKETLQHPGKTEEKHLAAPLIVANPAGQPLELFTQHPPSTNDPSKLEPPRLIDQIKEKATPNDDALPPSANELEAKSKVVKDIDRVMIFYKDKTFSVFLPE